MASPLKYFRKHQKVFLVVAAVVAMFVFVLGDMFLSMTTGPSSSGGDEVIPVWEGGEITASELAYLRERRALVNSMIQVIFNQANMSLMEEGGTPQEPTIPLFALPEKMTTAQLSLQVFDERVQATLAEEAGMVVSDRTINEYLNDVGMSRVTDQQILSGLAQIRGKNRVAESEKMLFSGIRELLLGHLYTSSLTVNASGVDPVSLWETWLQLNKRIKLEAAELPAEAFAAEVKDPSDAQLVSFYEENRNQFRTAFVAEGGRQFPIPQPGFREQPKVKLIYLVGDVEAWTEKMLEQVTEDEIADYYNRNKRQFTKYDPVMDIPEGGNPGMLDEIFLDEQDEDDAESAEESEPATQSDSAQEESAEQSAAEPTAETEIDNEKVESEDSDGSEAEPATEDTGAYQPSSPFLLAAFQDDAEATEEEESAESDEADLADEQSSTVEETAPIGEAEMEVDLLSGVEESEESPGYADDEEEYEPLENVKEEIRRSLAKDRAVELLTNTMDSAYGDISSVSNSYLNAVARAKDNQTDPPEVPEAITDLSALAKKYDLFYEETEPLSRQELFDIPVGKAAESQSRSQMVFQMAFSTLEQYDPLLAVDLDGYQYLVIKTADIPAETPPFKEIRDDVLAAWKLSEAKKLALKKGKEIAERATEEKLQIAAAMGEQEFEILETDFFSQVTFGTTPNRRQGVRLSEALPLEYVGGEFMKQAFALGDEDVSALPNFDGSKVYVVRRSQKENTEQELRNAFLQSFSRTQDSQYIISRQIQMRQNNILALKYAESGYDRRALEQALFRSPTQQQ